MIKNKRYKNSGFQHELLVNENPKYKGIIRKVETERNGKMVLIHREDGVIELWIEDVLCRKCKKYHGNSPFCQSL